VGQQDFVAAGRKLLEGMQDPNLLWEMPFARMYALFFMDGKEHTTQIQDREQWKELIRRQKERKAKNGQ
jgi:hypothetical protein